MSLFQCAKCGCCENTATSFQGCGLVEVYDWTGMEEWRGKRLCSACGPTRYRDGTPTGLGKWHDLFERVFLPLGMFQKNAQGNLEHVETGDTDYRKYARKYALAAPV